MLGLFSNIRQNCGIAVLTFGYDAEDKSICSLSKNWVLVVVTNFSYIILLGIFSFETDHFGVQFIFFFCLSRIFFESACS